jgi:hypothetical protein
MYANKVNLEIDAEVALELFNNNRVKVKLYTNKEDNEDAKGGEFLCSVAPYGDRRLRGAWHDPHHRWGVPGSRKACASAERSS